MAGFTLVQIHFTPREHQLEFRLWKSPGEEVHWKLATMEGQRPKSRSITIGVAYVISIKTLWSLRYFSG